MRPQLEYLLVCCLGLKQILDALLLVLSPMEEGLMLGLVEAGEGPHNLGQWW